ncbi:MAG TPA: hypothetical protein PKD00_02520 [Burkholderiales bacterium]|nr:hypothetical protein [Burkholderiales bacterium]
MSDTIFYSITRAENCDCYDLDEIQIGDCLTSSECVCLIGEENIDYTIDYINPTAPTYFYPDNVTPSGTLFDDGVLTITFNINPTGFFYTNEFACEFDTFEITPGVTAYQFVDFNVLEVYRIPSGITVSDTSNHVLVTASSYSVLQLTDEIYELTIGDIVAEYQDEYTASSRYMIYIRNSENNCFFNLYINQPFNYEMLAFINDPLNTTTFYDCDADEFTSTITLRNWSSQDDYITNPLIIPSGTTFTVWLNNPLIYHFSNLSMLVTFVGDSTSLIATGSTVTITPSIEDAPSLSFIGYDVELLVDWDPSDDLQINITRVFANCANIDAEDDDLLVVIGLPNTFISSQVPYYYFTLEDANP